MGAVGAVAVIPQRLEGCSRCLGIACVSQRLSSRIIAGLHAGCAVAVVPQGCKGGPGSGIVALGKEVLRAGVADRLCLRRSIRIRAQPVVDGNRPV